MIHHQDLLAGGWLSAIRSPDMDVQASLKNWWTLINDQNYKTPASLALYAGLKADRLAFAFAAGYQAALRHQFPDLGRQVGAFCVTEPQGAHPRQIQSELSHESGEWRLKGQKSFVSMADLAEQVFILAKRGESHGRPDLVMVQLPVSSTVLSLSKSLAYVPELAHGALTFDVVIEKASILPGDGYSDYSKAFRVLEDTYVSISVLGFLLSQGIKRAWPAELISDLLACIQLLSSITPLPVGIANTHLLLASALRQAVDLYKQADEQFTQCDDELALFWKRDKPLMGFAAKARALRFKSASAALEL